LEIGGKAPKGHGEQQGKQWVDKSWRFPHKDLFPPRPALRLF
jgi:hypothetical protein